MPVPESSVLTVLRDLRSDYNAAKPSRYKRSRGLPPTGAAADYHYRTDRDLLNMIETARDLDRNDQVVGQIVDRAVVNTIQDGISLDVQTGDPKLDSDLLAKWNAWATDPEQSDAAGELPFAGGIEELAFRQRLVDGDIVALALNSGHLQLIEAHRVRTPTNARTKVVHGVVLDDMRRRVQYWVTKEDLKQWKSVIRVSEVHKYSVRNSQGRRIVFHVYDPKRASQTRGVSALAPIIDPAGMFDDIQFAQLVRQQVVSCFAVFVQRDLMMAAGADATATGEQTTETLADGTSRVLEGIAPGLRIVGAPGERLEGFSPNVPNPEYFTHAKLILTIIGVNLGLPLILVLLDASQTNFSGWRGAMDQAKMGFRRNQRIQIARLNRPVYLWKVDQWLAEDSALRNANDKSTIDVYGHRWNPRRWPYVEPWKDAKADELRLAKNLTSHRRQQAELGADWDETSTELVEDRALLAAKAKLAADELNAKHPGVDIHWRELAGWSAPPTDPDEDDVDKVEQETSDDADNPTRG